MYQTKVIRSYIFASIDLSCITFFEYILIVGVSLFYDAGFSPALYYTSVFYSFSCPKERSNQKKKSARPSGQKSLPRLLTVNKWHSVTSAGINAMTQRHMNFFGILNRDDSLEYYNEAKPNCKSVSFSF